VAAESQSRSLGRYALLGGVVVVPLFLCGWYYILSRPNLTGIAAWLQTQQLAPGGHDGVKLPAEFRSSAANGTVDVFVSPNGRITFLLKTSIGWKHNYTGLIYSTAPFDAADIAEDYYGRDIIGIEFFGEPAIERKVNDQIYEVFFDLG
jgi:hypothetical protein